MPRANPTFCETFPVVVNRDVRYPLALRKAGRVRKRSESLFTRILTL